MVNMAKQENIDLIVVGNRGLGRTVALLLGSVSRKVVSDAYCNVLVVKK
jgi:nucleotide-binding universal stress UspA family protein